MESSDHFQWQLLLIIEVEKAALLLAVVEVMEIREWLIPFACKGDVSVKSQEKRYSVDEGGSNMVTLSSPWPSK